MTPAQQQSPWDAMHAISDQLTGQMADAATTRPDPDPAPGQWSAWARSGDRVIGAASLAGDQDPVPQDASEARRLVTVQQKVLHPDGATTPLERITATVDLAASDDEDPSRLTQPVRWGLVNVPLAGAAALLAPGSTMEMFSVYGRVPPRRGDALRRRAPDRRGRRDQGPARGGAALRRLAGGRRHQGAEGAGVHQRRVPARAADRHLPREARRQEPARQLFRTGRALHR